MSPKKVVFLVVLRITSNFNSFFVQCIIIEYVSFNSRSYIRKETDILTTCSL